MYGIWVAIGGTLLVCRLGSGLYCFKPPVKSNAFPMHDGAQYQNGETHENASG